MPVSATSDHVDGWVAGVERGCDPAVLTKLGPCLVEVWTLLWRRGNSEDGPG